MGKLGRLKCVKIFYRNIEISDDPIIRDYTDFLLEGLLNNTKPKLTLHFDSKAFDIVNVLVAFLSTAKKYIKNSFDPSSIQEGQMILYKKDDGTIERRHWLGINEEGEVVTRTDGTKNIPSCTYRIPYELVKDRITLYTGEANKTGVSGIREKCKLSEREFFLGYIFNEDPTNIPLSFLHTIEVIVDRSYFEDIINNTEITYSQNYHRRIRLRDIAHFAYETMNGKLQQFTSNSAKLNNTFIYTDKLSTARSRIFDNNGLPITLLILKDLNDNDSLSDIQDFLDVDKDIIQDVIVSTDAYSNISNYLIDLNTDLNINAYTPDKLESLLSKSIEHNFFIYNKAKRAITPSVEIIDIDGGLDINDYFNIIKKCNSDNIPSELRDDYKMSIRTLLKLSNTLCFPSKYIENANSRYSFNREILTPEKCIENIKHINPTDSLIKVFTGMFNNLNDNNNKYNEITEIIEANPNSKIIIAVEKYYYKQILADTLNAPKNVKIISVSELKDLSRADVVILTSLANKKINLHKLSSEYDIKILLYDNEKYFLNKISRKNDNYMKRLHMRIRGTLPSTSEYENAVIENEATSKEINENFNEIFEEISTFNPESSFRQYISSKSNSTQYGDGECEYVGVLSGGYKIAFSKYYSATIYDSVNEQVIEKKPEELAVGDQIIFMKDSKVKDGIVNQIFIRLYEEHILPDSVKDLHIKASVWRRGLIDYVEQHEMSVTALHHDFNKKMETSFSYPAFINWLYNPSVLGPKNPETLILIGEYIGNSDLVANYKDYFEAIKQIRHQRLQIIKLISKAVEFSLSSNERPDDIKNNIILNEVYEKVKDLSVILTLDQIIRLDNPQRLTINILNKPIPIEED